MLHTAGADGIYALPPAYVDTATPVAALQVSKAAIRLAFLHNRGLTAGRESAH
jgi:hypothetical protein